MYDEHTPAQAKKQAGRESFLRISSGRTLPLLGDHELALALQDARMLLGVEFAEDGVVERLFWGLAFGRRLAHRPYFKSAEALRTTSAN